MKFGWCIDNRHEQCRAITSPPDGELICSCHCHDPNDGVDEFAGDSTGQWAADLAGNDDLIFNDTQGAT